MPPKNRTLDRERIRGVTPAIVTNARDLRRRMTPAERLLWGQLRDRRFLGLKFRRQYEISSYILDFCCPSLRVVIELDGAGHADARQAWYDAGRSEQLAAYGYRVLRFTNAEVLDNVASVLQRIEEAVGDGPHPPTRHSEGTRPNPGRGGDVASEE